MATKRRLNIVVDGNAELAPYWPKIVSDYLVKIVRCFCDNPREQGAKNAIYELGLVMYNANSDIGYDVQYIQWTKDVDYFLGCLSCLAFNGDCHNQYAMAEGLAEALMMYPRDYNGVEDYYNGERHCILVSVGVPVPRKMLVTVPRIRERELVIGTPLDTFSADFLQVAQLFNPLAISLSVITPEQHAIFGQIFNLGNNTEMTYAPLSNYKVDQFVILLSKNFKEAREALHEKGVLEEDSSRKRTLEESMRTTSDITLDHITPDELFNSVDLQEILFSVGNTTIMGEQGIENSYRKRSVEPLKATDFITLTDLFTGGFQEDLDLFSAAKATVIGDQTIEDAKAVRPELKSVASTESQVVDEVIPNPITDQNHVSVSSSSSVSPGNVFEDIMAELLNADIDIFLPNKKSKTCFTLEEDSMILPAQPTPFEDILKEVEADFEKALESGNISIAQNKSTNQTCFVDLTKDDKEVQISPSVFPKVPSTTSSGIIGNNSSSALLLNNHSSSSGFITLGGNSSSAFITLQNSSSLRPAAPQPWYKGVESSEVNTGVRSNGFGKSLFPHGNSNSAIQIQPCTASLLNLYPNASSNNQFGGGLRGNFSSGSSLLLREQNLRGYQYQRDISMSTGYDPLNIPHAFGRNTSWAPPIPRNMPQVTQTGPLLLPPTLMNLRDYSVHTWEGCISGNLPSGKTTFIRARGFRRATSPFTLTFQWSGRLEMKPDIPLRVVVHTQRLMCDQIDYVYFHVTQDNNRDLYDFLKRSNMCAKIDLPAQNLILYPTESEFYYVGIVFPWDTIFVEPKCI